MKKKLLCSIAIFLSCIMMVSAFTNSEGFLFATENKAAETDINGQNTETIETSDDKTTVPSEEDATKKVDEKDIDKNEQAADTDKQEAAKNTPITLTAKVNDGVNVVVQGDNVTLANVTKVRVEKLPKAELEKVNVVLESALKEESKIQAYDITLTDEAGNIIQPKGEVQVSFENVALKEDVDVYHVDTDKKQVEDMKAVQAKDGAITFETTHFSTYVLRTAMPRAATSTAPIGDPDLVQISMDQKYEIASNKVYSLQFHVYTDTGATTVYPGEGQFYSLPEFSAQSKLTLDLTSSGYEVQKVVMKQLYNSNYNKATVANGTKINLKNGKYQVGTLNRSNNQTNFIDIYLTPKSQKTLILKNELDSTGLTEKEKETELKKSYKYQLFDAQTDEPIKGIFDYNLVIDGNVTSLKTVKDGIFRMRTNREIQIDVTGLDGKQVYVKQLNGAQYETSVKMNDNNFSVSEKKQSKDFTADKENITIITYRNKRLDIADLIEHGKTSNIKNWNDRTYEISLSAGYKNNEVTKVENANLQFILDVSGSMLSTDAAVSLSKLSDLDKLNKHAVYFTKKAILDKQGTDVGFYGQGITFFNGGNKDYDDQIKERLKFHLYSGVYGVISTTNNNLIFFDEISQTWKYIEIPNNGPINTASYTGAVKDINEAYIQSHQTVYCDRSSVLIDAVTNFVKGMNADSQVSIITFGGGAKDLTNGFLTVGKNREKLLNLISQCSGEPYQGTAMGAGLKLAEQKINGQNGTYNSIVFSDGAPSLPDGSAEQDAIDGAKALKKVSSVYAVGAGEFNSDLMKNSIASSPDQFLSSSNMTDIYELLQIISDEVGEASVNATITDYIDSHFFLIDENGNPLKEGDKITSEEGIVGIVGQDEKGWFVKWENQIITTGKSTWTVHINVKAKDDFMGNNQVTTNGDGSQIEIPDGDDTDIIEFDKPKVNVKELLLTGGKNSKVIFYGEDEEYAAVFGKELPTFSASNPNVEIPELTIEELKELLSSDGAKVTKSYTYEGKKEGSFIYTVKQTEDSKEIICTYVPKMSSQDDQTAKEVQAKWEYAFDRVKGQLDITKSINEQYTTEEKINANQSFIFRIERRENKGDKEAKDVYYQVIDFSANGNDKTKTVSIKGLKKGYYTVMEETNWSWKYDLIAQLDNDEKNQNANQLMFIGRTDDTYYGVEEGTTIKGIQTSPIKSNFTNGIKTALKDILGDVATAINLLK